MFLTYFDIPSDRWQMLIKGNIIKKGLMKTVTFDAQEALSMFDIWNTCTHRNLQRVFDAVYNRHVSKGPQYTVTISYQHSRSASHQQELLQCLEHSLIEEAKRGRSSGDGTLQEKKI